MAKRKSQRIKEPNNYLSLLSNDEDDDFACQPQVKKKLKKEMNKLLESDSDTKMKNINKLTSVVDMMKTDQKPKRLTREKIFEMELQKAIELSKSSQQSVDVVDPDMPILHIIQNDLELKKNTDSTNIEQISNNSEDNLPPDILKMNIVSTDVPNENILNHNSESLLKIYTPSAKPKVNINKNINLNNSKDLVPKSRNLSPLHGNLRLGLSRNSRIKSLHPIK